MLPPEEETLLLDNYDSDCEGERESVTEEDSEQGCLKVMVVLHIDSYRNL